MSQLPIKYFLSQIDKMVMKKECRIQEPAFGIAKRRYKIQNQSFSYK